MSLAGRRRPAAPGDETVTGGGSTTKAVPTPVNHMPLTVARTGSATRRLSGRPSPL
ncbi:hypothetical protein [Streptomyces sp. NPDC059863]|uniref:hypothetical protein n=1 Tax=unclassified Streptomyces TaxID=2593676 RepID=UPI00366331F9